MPGRLAVATLLLVAMAVLVLALGLYLIPTDADPPASAPARVSSASGLNLLDVLGAARSVGFEQAVEPREFRFPQDHGPHIGFRTEWWYVTGLLKDEVGTEFGFQLTFFRLETAPGLPPPERPQLYLAHFSVTDVGRGVFHALERSGRGDLGTAGASAMPLEVFVDHWAIRADGERWRLHASDAALALDLTLEPVSGVVLQGEGGLSRKGNEPAAASYYYSVPHWRADGELRIGSRAAMAVSGAAWLDREWSTSALGQEQAGWDWFGLRLDDGSALMFYQLRLRDGSVDPNSNGSLIAADGHKRSRGSSEVSLAVLAHWESDSGTEYPAQWLLTVKNGPRLRITPLVAGQLWTGTFRYWEGAVHAEGVGPEGQALNGEGYVELTGYER